MFSNPYYGETFWKTILLFFYRLGLLVSGHLSFADLATDDIQILTLAGVGVSSALVGAFLVLRRMTMLANSLSHTILMGIVLAYVFSISNAYATDTDHFHSHSSIPPMGAMLMASLLMGFITAFLTEFLTKVGRLQEDASTGLVFTSLFALGVILLTILTRDAHIGTEAVMGNADSLHRNDLFWVYAILLGNVILFSLFFKEYKITTFDPALAAALGFSNLFYNYLLMAQVSATSIGAFRAVGVLLVLAFMTGPVLTARLLTHRLKPLLVLASGIGALASLVGVAIARHLLSVYDMPLSTSGIVVCVIAAFYVLAILFAPEQGLLVKWLHRRRILRN